MLKKTITYEDFNGETVTEDFYFNLTQAEVVELNYSVNGGLESYIKGITNARDYKDIIALFKEIIKLSYGVKSNDGKRFIKSEQITSDFLATNAYSTLFMELATDAEAGAAFVNGIAPKPITKNGSATPPQIAAGK